MIEKFKTNAEVIENGDKYLYGNHVRMPLSIERGEGAYVFDKDGNKYLDFIGGIAVNGLGHCHPAIVKCLEERAHTILHCFSKSFGLMPNCLKNSLLKYDGDDMPTI